MSIIRNNFVLLTKVSRPRQPFSLFNCLLHPMRKVHKWWDSRMKKEKNTGHLVRDKFGLEIRKKRSPFTTMSSCVFLHSQFRTENSKFYINFWVWRLLSNFLFWNPKILQSLNPEVFRNGTPLFPDLLYYSQSLKKGGGILKPFKPRNFL